MSTANETPTTLLDRCWDLMISDPAAARLLAEQVIAQTQPGDDLYTDALSQMGLCDLYSGEFENATHQLNEALSQALQFHHDKFLGRISNALGMSYQAIGSYGAALDNFEYAISLAKEKTADHLVAPLANIASLMFDMGELESAEHYVNEVLGLDLTGVLEDNLVELYLLQAQLFLSSLRFDEAKLALNETQQLAQKLEFRFAILRSKTLTGRLFRLQGELQRAVDLLTDLVQNDDLEAEGTEAIGTYIELSKALFSLQRQDEALEYLCHCLNRFQLPEQSPLRLRILEQMAHGYLLQGNFEAEAQCLRDIRTIEQSAAMKEHHRLIEIRELKRKQEQAKQDQLLADRENQLLQASHDRLSLLNDIAHQITMTLDFKELGKRLYSILSRHMDVHFVSLLTVDEHKKVLNYRFVFDQGDSVQAGDVALNKPGSNAAKAFNSGRPVSIEDNDDLAPENTIGDGNLNPRSLLFVPLILEEERLGVFSMQSPKPHRFDHQELHLMVAICRFIAIATSNIISHEKVSTLNKILFDEKKAIIEAQERIEHMAYHDALTSLPNRQALEEFIERRFDSQTHFHLIYIDLDGFKPVNDRFGHRLGDVVLVEIGRRIKKSLRMHDFAARVGGDEFVLVMSQLEGPDALKSFLSRLLGVIEEPILSVDRELSVSASIGCSHYPDHGESLDQLMHFADQAMYEIKRSGKGGYKAV